MSVTKIISGGQTGADMGGLKAAKILKLQTGGTVPKGCNTEDGPNPKLVTKYGCKESWSEGYQPRTIVNVCNSDGSIIFAENWNSPGTVCTMVACSSENKPTFKVSMFSIGSSELLELFTRWLGDNNIKVLNIAGHRESVCPGIEKLVTLFLTKALKKGRKKCPS